jgi:hypothetical protein
MNTIRHNDGTKDGRYSIQRVWCGYPTRQWVAYFCGQWLGCAPTQMGALDLARKHQEARLAVLEGRAS